MLIRYIFGPRAGETEHVDRVSAKPLILAQIAEAVNPDDLKEPNDGAVRKPGDVPYRLPRAGDAVIPAPQWSLDTITLPGLGDHPLKKVLVIRMDLVNQVSRWFGEPKNANVRAGHRWLNGFGREIPKDILEAYTRRWKADSDLRAPKDLLNPPKAKPSGFSHRLEQDERGNARFVLVDE